MDKIKEKLEKLRIEGEEATVRAEKAEALVKTLNDTQVKHENTIQTLNNKLKLLQAELDRAAPTDVKSLHETIQAHETSIKNLNNKIALLQTELERSEQRAEQNKASKLENDKDGDEKDSLKRKVQMLEKQLEDKELERKEAIEKCRKIDFQAEAHDRRAKQLEVENGKLATELENKNSQYLQVKAELDETNKALEGL